MWLLLTALALLTASSLLSVALLWRRVRRLEQRVDERVRKEPFPSGPSAFDSVELSFAAMLAELEAKSRSILAEVEQRAAAVRRDGKPQHPPASPTFDPRQAAPPAPGEGPTNASNESDASPKAMAVRRLAAEGHDVLTIARRLGLGKGEVQLILNLDEHEAQRPSDP